MRDCDFVPLAIELTGIGGVGKAGAVCITGVELSDNGGVATPVGKPAGSLGGGGENPLGDCRGEIGRDGDKRVLLWIGRIGEDAVEEALTGLRIG